MNNPWVFNFQSYQQDKAKPSEVPYKTPFILQCWAQPVQIGEMDDSEFEQVSV